MVVSTSSDVDALRRVQKIWDSLRVESGLTEETIEQANIAIARADQVPPTWAGDAAVTFNYISPVGAFDSWRTRLYGGDGGKYFAMPNSGTYMYFSPMMDLSVLKDPTKPLHITEGEKKTLCGVQHGFNFVGFSGVNNWCCRKYELEMKYLKKRGKGAIYDVPPDYVPDFTTHVAHWLLDIAFENRLVTVTFDHDVPPNSAVRKACFEFAIWAYRHGAHVVEAPLPLIEKWGEKKVGLDDFLTYWQQKDQSAAPRLQEILDSPNLLFPRHPNLRRWLVEQTERGKLSRDTADAIAKAVVSDLDYKGRRYIDWAEDMYYFMELTDDHQRKLHSFTFSSRRDQDALRTTEFGRKLMAEYGMHSDDNQLISAVADRYSVDAPVSAVHPRRLSYATADHRAICLQTGDTKYLRITGDPKNPWDTRDNGADVMFHAGVVQDHLNVVQVMAYLDEFKAGTRKVCRMEQMLSRTNIRSLGSLTRGETVNLLAAILYIVPWLRGWNQVQLPVIQILGENNAGKSTLAVLWRWIQNGSTRLDSFPDSLRDWKTSVIVANGSWIGDNANNIDPSVRKQINDEVARLVTALEPMFTERKLFNNSGREVRFLVDTVFALTAITTPFTSNDVIERTVTLRLNKTEAGSNYNWLEEFMSDRELWVAEIAYVLHRFLHLTMHRGEWLQTGYRSQHRLNNFEQAVYFALRACSPVPLAAQRAKELAAILQSSVVDEVRSLDAALEAMIDWANYWHSRNGTNVAAFTVVMDWFSREHLGEYGDIGVFETKRKFGRYLEQNQGVLEQMAGIRVEYLSNARVLRVLHPTQRNRT